MRFLFTLLGLFFVLAGCSEQNSNSDKLNKTSKNEGFDISKASLIDLSHSYGPDSLYWPTSPTKFELTNLSAGVTPGGWYYSANTFSMPEHGGTPP